MSSHRRALLLILLLALLPLLIGGSLFYLGWRPAKSSHHGTLITPPVPVGVDGIKGKWSLLLVDDPVCGPACKEKLDELRRVRVVLAKNWQRTQSLHLSDRNALPGDFATGTIVIVDPNGLAMMRYAPGAKLEGVLADLELLLKYSWIG